MNKKSLFSIVIFLAFTLFLYQNCGQEFLAYDDSQQSSSLADPVVVDEPTPEPEPTLPELPEPEPLPEFMTYLQPNLVPGCAQNANFNACIFWKNPVGQRGMPYASPILSTSDISADQTHAVRILGTDGSGNLRNSSINVMTTTGTRVLATDNNFKRAYPSQAHQVTQLMVYHWMQTFISFIKLQTGTYHAENRMVQVDAVTANYEGASFRTTQNDVRMGITSGGTSFGLSGEIAVHELGHANHRWATDNHYSALNSQACPTNIGGTCCTSAANGCPRALAEGAGDYTYYMLFPNSPTGGESLTNTLLGTTNCGLSRNVNRYINLTVSNIPCSQIHALGIIYAGIWAEVRKRAEALTPNLGAKKVDTLFTEHLLVLRDDGWLSIFNKIATLDQAMNSGELTPLFRAEFQRRQINIP